MEELPERALLPSLEKTGSHTIWVYDSPGEPVFALTFELDAAANVITLDVTPMHLNGDEAKPVRIVAQ